MQQVHVNRRSALISAGLALLLFTCFAGIAQGAVKVSVKPFTEYPIESPGPHQDVRIKGNAEADDISLSLDGPFLKVNGHDPAGEPIEFSDVVLLHVTGGPGADSINLRGMRGFEGLFADELNVGGKFVVAGQAGDDLIVGLGVSTESIESTRPESRLYVSTTGGRGDDRLIGSRAGDAISGGPGADRIYGLDAPDGLKGGPGNDRIWGGSNEWFGNRVKRDVIYGGSGNDVLFGGPGDDLMLGKEGDDKLFGGPGRDTMYQNTKSRRGYGPGGVGCKGAPPGICNPIIN